MPQSDRTFRIFVSSTFNDFRAERNALQERVFPRLRDLCRANGARFQPIDLRWGVSEEAGLDQRTVEICLAEITRSQQVSPRPNFIVLLGDRYGWRPLPLRIPAAEFEALLARMGEAARVRAQFWYRRDDNAVPPVYLLEPRVAEYRDRTRWSALEQGLRLDLSAAAVALGLSADAADRYQTSATEQEIASGVLQSEAPERHVFCYFRRIENLPSTAADFLDLDPHGEEDRDAATRLERVKAMLRLRLGANVHDYRAAWAATGVAEDHLRAFCDDVYADLSRTILAELADGAKLDVLAAEIAAHARFGAERAQAFLGRADELAAIAKYAAADEGFSRRPLLIVGDPGSGKSTLMAQAARRLAESSPGTFVIQRFLGATASSADPASLLRGLCHEIYRRCDIEQVKQRRLDAIKDDAYKCGLVTAEFEIAGDVTVLGSRLRGFLELIPAGRRMVIFLDALDQLAASPGSEAVAWLPSWLPAGARLVVSSIAGTQMSAVRGALEGADTLTLDAMAVEESDALLDSWLAAAGRRLQPPQRTAVTAAFQGRRLPLSLKLVFETVRLWTSFDAPEALANDAPTLFRAFLHRLSDDSSHGERLVSRALGYLAAARHGLAEDEILDLLSPAGDPSVMADFRRRSPLAPQADRLPVVVWSRLFFDIEPYLSVRRADGASLLGFYHRTLLDVVDADYLSGEAGRDIRARIAAYFQRQQLYADGGLNARKLSEEPYVLTRAGEWAALFPCLSDVRRLELVASRRDESSEGAAGIGQIEADLSLALALWPASGGAAERAALALIAAAVEAEGDLFARRPDLIAAQLYSRLRAKTDLLTATLEDQARHWRTHAWLRTKQPLPQSSLQRAVRGGGQGGASIGLSPDRGLCLLVQESRSAGERKTASLQLLNVATGREYVRLIDDRGFTQAWAFSPDGSRLVTAGTSRELALWSTESGARLGAAPLDSKWMMQCVIDPSGRYAVAVGDGGAWAWDLRDHSLRRFAVAATVWAVAISQDGKRILAGADDGIAYVLDLATGELQRRMPVGTGLVRGLTFSPDGQLLAAWSTGGLKVWEAGDLKELWTRSFEGQFVAWGCFSPDSRLLLFGRSLVSGRPIGPGPGLNRDPIACDAATGLERFRLSGHDGEVRDGAFSAGGAMLATAGADGALKLWDASDGTLLNTLAGHDGRVRACAFVQGDATVVSAGDDGAVRFWAAAPATAGTARQGQAATHCRFTPDGGRMISAGADGVLRLWNTDDGQCVRELRGHQGAVTDIAVSPDSTDVVSSGVDSLLRVWSLTTGTERLVLRGHEGAVLACAAAPDGRVIASGGVDHTVRLWDRQSGASIATLRGHTDAVTACAFAPDGTWLATGSDDADGTLRLWDMQSRATRSVLGEGAPAVFRMLDGASASWGMAVAMGAMSQEEVGALMASAPKPEGHESGVQACVVSPDGSWLASIAHKEQPIVWDVATGHERPAVADRRTGYNSVQYARPSGAYRSKLSLSGDGRTLAWIDYAERAETWDTRHKGDGAKTVSLAATSVAVSPSGALIAVGQRGGLICVYDAVLRVERAALRLAGEITGIEWHPSLPLLACVDTSGYCYLVEVFLP
jgi:WD40 repeat protein